MSPFRGNLGRPLLLLPVFLLGGWAIAYFTNAKDLIPYLIGAMVAWLIASLLSPPGTWFRKRSGGPRPK